MTDICCPLDGARLRSATYAVNGPDVFVHEDGTTHGGGCWNCCVIVERRPGQTLMDREALAQWTSRSVNTIRARCTPVDRTDDGRPLYDAEACYELLATIPKRRRPART